MNGKGSRCRIGNFPRFRENHDGIDFSLEVKCERCGHEFKSKSAVPVCSKCGRTAFAPRKKGQRMAGMRFGRITQ